MTHAVSLYGMNESFRNIRAIAAKKRDKAIKAAKLEYNETIQKIAELEARLKTTRTPRPGARAGKPKLADLVYEAIPDDKPFTLNDLIGTLKAKHPERNWIKQSVNVAVNRFLKAGAIKRIAHAGHKRAAVFALPEVDLPEAKTMLDWAKGIEGWREMEPVELMVKMTEAGFQMEVAPKDAVRSLEKELIRADDIDSKIR